MQNPYDCRAFCFLMKLLILNVGRSKINHIMNNPKAKVSCCGLVVVCVQVIHFLRGKEGFLSLVLKHIDTSAMMDVLLRLISCVEPPALRLDTLTVSKNSVHVLFCSGSEGMETQTRTLQGSDTAQYNVSHPCLKSSHQSLNVVFERSASDIF